MDHDVNQVLHELKSPNKCVRNAELFCVFLHKHTPSCGCSTFSYFAIVDTTKHY